MKVIIMKKQILIAALGFVSVGSFAQTFHEESGFPCAYTRSVPACYLKDANPCLLVHDDLYYVSNTDKRDIYVYDKNLSLVKSWSFVGKAASMYFVNANNGGEDAEFFFSQTLFNDDDSFEYFLQETTGEGADERTFALRVMSDNGRELARISFDEPLYRGVGIDIIHFDEKDYLLIDGMKENNVSFSKLYSIKKSSDGQTAIQEVPQQAGLSALPSLARRNENVNIRLGNHAGGRLQVTSANGSVVRQMLIQEGQTSVQLNTRGLSADMYVVSVVDANGTQENCKIVIR